MDAEREVAVSDSHRFLDPEPNPLPGHTHGCQLIGVENATTGHTIYISRCAVGCPHLDVIIQRGRQLSEEHGWTTSSPPPS